MIEVFSKALDEKMLVGRTIGQFSNHGQGPTIVFTAGIHGNEPSGVFALKKVFDELRTRNTVFKGNIYGLCGNLWALEQGVRYHTQDLNRLWNKEQLSKLKDAQPDMINRDEREFIELHALIEKILQNNEAPYYFMDLHTTSSQTNPFLTINDCLLNRKFTQAYPLPIILGIEEYLDGPILSYLNELGFVAFGFEGGQHDDLSSIENHKAFIYLSLFFTGCIDKEDFDYQHYYDLLIKTSIDSRDIYEIFYHYRIQETEQFKMKPGFVNFMRIQVNQTLAASNGHQLKALHRGRILMPLYQSRGRDGFFIIRRLHKFWFRLSAGLRNMKLHRFLIMLPGVSWVSNQKDQLIVNKSIARFFARDFFHLLGYRIKKIDKSHLIMTNRESRARYHEYKKAPWYNG